MGVKKSIFGSAAEAQGFRSIERTWGQDYKLFPNIPFSMLFEPKKEWRDTSNFFFKTSIDYVLCTDAGEPLIAIDFDGLGGGYDTFRSYRQIREVRSDPNRKVKMDFKLRFARKDNFPYHIVASDEFQNLDDDIALTVVDGIIGHCLAVKDFEERAQSVLDEHADEIRRVPVAERGESVDSLLFETEFDAYRKHDVILGKCMEIIGHIEEVSNTEILDFYGATSEPVMVKDGWVARKSTVSHRDVGKVSALAILRDSSIATLLVKDIAELLAYSKLLRLLQEQQLTA